MGLNILTEFGRQGMLYAQASLQISGKNITNANTKGYSRQRLDVNPILPEILAGFSLGGAISGDSLRRIREEFIDRQFWIQNAMQGQYETEESLLRQVEGLLPEPTEKGLRNLLVEFWDAWNNLANDPESSVTRTVLRDKGQTLTMTFNRLFKQYTEFQSSIGNEISSRVDQINNLTAQLAMLNKSNPGDNYDLEDQRVRLLDQLSRLADVDIQQDDRSVSVYLSGMILVAGNDSFELSFRESFDDTGVGTLSTYLGSGTWQVDINSGELGAMLKVYNEDIPDFLANLDTVAVSMAQQVNAIHQTGFDLSGNTGQNFFAADVVGAASFALDSTIAANPNFIAASDALGESGNNNIALALATLGDTGFISNKTPEAYYRALVGTLGNRIQEMGFLTDSQAKVVDHLELQRNSISSVSIEEEMTRMVQFEQAFTAASRLVATADELTRTLLQMI